MGVSILGEAAVRLRPNADGFEAEAETGILGPLTGVAKRAAGLFAAAFAAEKVGDFLKESVTQASDLSESTSKVGVVFGDSAQQVLDFAANASTAFGQTRGQALEAAGTFGNLLRSIGLTADESANMSTKMVGLASDLASFNNTDPAEALDALRSGLTGETEPLKRYGINLNDATLKAEALRLGLDASGATLSANTKAQAAYSLIMQQSSLAQGDFARTSAGLANQQRIMSSQWTDLQANIGGLFVPALANASGVLTGRLMPALLHATEGATPLGNALGQVGDVFRAAFSGDDAALEGLTGGMVGLAADVNGVAIATGSFAAIFGEAMADGKAGADLLAADGLDGIAARAGVAAHHVQQEFAVAFASLKATADPFIGQIGLAFDSTWASVKASAGSAFAGIGATISDAFGGGAGGAGGGFLSRISSMFGGAIQAAVPVIQGLIERIGPAITPMLVSIGNVFSTLGPAISGVFSQLAPVFAQLGPTISAILPVLAQLASFWRDVLLQAFQALLPVLPTIVQGLGTIVGALLSGLLPVIQQLAPVIGQVVSAFQGALVGAIQALVPVIPTLVDALVQIAGVLAQSLGPILEALLPIFPAVADVVGQVASMLAGALAQALQAIIPILPPIIDALMQVAQVLIGVVMQALQAILPVIPSLVEVFLTLIQAALVPLLPILPLLANLFATIISALAPLIPPIIQIITLIIQLVVAAITPLMPLLTIAANLFTMLVSAIIPIIQVLLTVIGAVLGFVGTVIGAIVGFVSTVVGIFSGLFSAVTGIFGAIFGAISGVWNSIFGFVSGIVSKIAGVISGVFHGVADAIGGVFSGIGSAVHNVFDSVVGFIKGIINGAIGILNAGIDFINTKLIDTANKVPFVDIPHIPHIPTLHEGGVFQSNVPAGEGLALLRDDELVITPEQRTTADHLLRALLDGNVPQTPAAATASAAEAAPAVVNHITQLPGEDGLVLAARVSQSTVWNLNNGTRRVGTGAVT